MNSELIEGEIFIKSIDCLGSLLFIVVAVIADIAHISIF